MGWAIIYKKKYFLIGWYYSLIQIYLKNLCISIKLYTVNRLFIYLFILFKSIDQFNNATQFDLEEVRNIIDCQLFVT